MSIIYARLSLITLFFTGISVKMSLLTCQNFGDLIRGKVKFKRFMKKAIMGLFICLCCTVMSTILMGSNGLLIASLPLVAFPLLLIAGLVSSFTGDRFDF